MKTQWQSVRDSKGTVRLRKFATWAVYFLTLSAASASLYVGSSNNLGSGIGAIYQYSSTGTLLSTTDPGFAGGSGVLTTLQGGTGKIYASTGGYIQVLSSDLATRQVVGGGFGNVSSIASMSDGRVVLGSDAGGDAFFWWNSSGVYSGSFGGGWLNSTIAIGLNDTMFTTYDTGSQFNLGKWNSDFSFDSILANDVGNSLKINSSTGQLWTAGNASGQVLRFDANGVFVEVIGNGWDGGILASSADGRMWLASSSLGGVLASWGSDGTYLGVAQQGIGGIAALTVDPTTGEVYLGLTDSSGGGINRYSSDGTYINTFGANLGITSLMATVPEPTSVGLLALGGIIVAWRVRRRSSKSSLDR